MKRGRLVNEFIAARTYLRQRGRLRNYSSILTEPPYGMSGRGPVISFVKQHIVELSHINHFSASELVEVRFLRFAQFVKVSHIHFKKRAGIVDDMVLSLKPSGNQKRF